MTRRWLLQLIAALPTAFASSRSFSIPVDTGLRVGAIRWDAWYGTNKAHRYPEWHASQNLNAPQFNRRAPFFARKLNNGQMSIKGNQSDMDAEIAFAADAGINFWAFCWYPAGRPLRRAWELYEQSAARSRINWCPIVGLNSFAYGRPAEEELLKHFASDRYEKVHGKRPLIFLLHEKTELDRASKTLAKLRNACASHDLGDPYVVIQSASARLSANSAGTIGADAASAYASIPRSNGAVPYTSLTSHLERFWSEMAATGMQVVPNGMTGWDVRPRILRPQPPQLKGNYGNAFVLPGTTAEIAAHIGALISFARERPQQCPGQTVLIYSWNECDEGGSVLCPSWTAFGADRSILDAVATSIHR